MTKSLLSKAPVSRSASEQGPQDIWAGIEDIWLRLRAHCAVKLSCQQGIYELVFHGFKTAAMTGHVSQLRSLVPDLETYTWQVGGVRGQFIDFIEYKGSDLVLHVKPMSHIQRWLGGEDIASEVKSFLLRLQRMGQLS
jgi:hypothetical protein